MSNEGYQKSQPVRTVEAIGAGWATLITVLAGSALLADNELVKWVLFVLSVGLAVFKAVMAVLLPQATVPYQDAVAYINQNGDPVAGPASPLPNGTPVVTKTEPIQTSNPADVSFEEITPDPEPETSKTVYDYSTLSYNEIRSEAKGRGLPAGGTKAQLLDRLRQDDEKV